MVLQILLEWLVAQDETEASLGVYINRPSAIQQVEIDHMLNQFSYHSPRAS